MLNLDYLLSSLWLWRASRVLLRPALPPLALRPPPAARCVFMHLFMCMLPSWHVGFLFLFHPAVLGSGLCRFFYHFWLGISVFFLLLFSDFFNFCFTARHFCVCFSSDSFTLCFTAENFCVCSSSDSFTFCFTARHFYVCSCLEPVEPNTLVEKK